MRCHHEGEAVVHGVLDHIRRGKLTSKFLVPLRSDRARGVGHCDTMALESSICRLRHQISILDIVGA